MSSPTIPDNRRVAFGTNRLSVVDRFGIWLSRRGIVREIAGRRDLSVLELGCGHGARNLFAIEAQAASLVAVDFNLSDAVKEHPKFIGVESSIDGALPQLAERRFDLILLISVLEHLEDPLRILTQCRKMLSPGGALLVNVPTWLGKVFLELAAFKLNLAPKAEMDDHKMYYDKRDLWPLLVKAGFLPSTLKLRYHKFRLNLFAVAKEAR
jgi:2-polyprenyl-3-methyl-5-hydroxy-6-metoxy-1,4-benzoquinol methylase